MTTRRPFKPFMFLQFLLQIQDWGASGGNQDEG
jgi:hypothetical protein